MSLKVKLVSIIASIFLVIAIVTVGVYAASSGSISIGGTVSFVAKDVLCLITGEVTNSSLTAPTLNPLEWTLTDKPLDTDLETWTGNSLGFNFDDTAIVYTITIQNNSTERYIKATLSQNVTNASLSATYEFENESETYDTIALNEEFQIPAGETRSLKISFTYAGDKDTDTTLDYSYTLTLVDPNHTEE